MSEKGSAPRPPKMPSVFYGINLQLLDGQKRPEDLPQFCTSIQEVQSIIKANKTARFKSFASQTEAEAYSQQALDPPETASSPPGAPVVNAEKPSPYKAPSRPEFQRSAPYKTPFPPLSPPALVKRKKQCSIAYRAPPKSEIETFRGLVERGDATGVAAAVSRNPRFLVNSGDTPAILREGPRHNALHLAALHDRAEVCARLLDMVADPALFRRLYPDDEAEVAAGRAEYMVDLYLNMPTKGTFETPLHLASKLGHAEVVRVLVQQPACKRDAKNKFGETPEQVICKQCRDKSAAAALSRQLTFLLQEPFYVQVLADADGCEPPVLAPPCSPQRQHRPRTPEQTSGSPSPLLHSPLDSPLDSPVDSPLRPRAWAGPMPRQLADEFHRRWRSTSHSPLKNRRSRQEDVRMTDAGKGWERVGRELAVELSVEWHEYWPFLGRHLNITSETGLQALEAHLHAQTYKLMQPPSPQLEEVSRRLELAPNGPASPTRVTPVSRRSRISPKSPISPVSALCRDLRELRLDESPLDCAVIQPDPPSPRAPYRKGRLRELLRNRQCSEPLPVELDSDGSCEDDEEFFTPPSSSGSLSPVTPTEAPEVFIHGRQPTTADLDVYRALEAAVIDPATYPNIHNWRCQVKARSRTQGFRRVLNLVRTKSAPAGSSPPPRPPAVVPDALPSPVKRVLGSPVLAMHSSPMRSIVPRPFFTPRRLACRRPTVPEGDGSPLRMRSSASPLTRLRPVNGHL